MTATQQPLFTIPARKGGKHRPLFDVPQKRRCGRKKAAPLAIQQPFDFLLPDVRALVVLLSRLPKDDALIVDGWRVDYAAPGGYPWLKVYQGKRFAGAVPVTVETRFADYCYHVACWLVSRVEVRNPRRVEFGGAGPMERKTGVKRLAA